MSTSPQRFRSLQHLWLVFVVDEHDVEQPEWSERMKLSFRRVQTEPGLYGLTQCEDQTIWLWRGPERNAEQVSETFAHELGHVMCYELGLNAESEASVAGFVASVFKFNDVMEWFANRTEFSRSRQDSAKPKEV